METTVRLKAFTIRNIKNVRYGRILMPDALEKVPDRERAGVLGIYGQNGSGKTAVIDALYFLRLVMAGEPLPQDFTEFADVSSDTVSLEAVYYLFLNDDVREITYELTLRRAQNRFIIASETLSGKVCTPEDKGRKSVILGAVREDEEVRLHPQGRLRALYKEDAKNRTELKVALRIADKENTSFLFSAVMREILLTAGEESIPGLKTTVDIMNRYAADDMAVILMEKAGRHQGSFRLSVPSSTEPKIREEVLVSLEGPEVYTLAETKAIQDFAESIDVVLPAIIPGMKLVLRDYGAQTDDEGREGRRLELLSQREGMNAIPLRRESEGIVRIISLLSALIRAFSDPSALLAVDELDAGVYEYMLGELLDIFENNARGQLIFTSHNLRALEMLEDKSVMFSTANPENRYIRMKRRNKKSSLRDDYLRGITLGGQEEVIYEETDSLKIARAFRKAAEVTDHA